MGPAASSGLGLSVVKAITEAQGGTVTLTSDPTGTSVSLALPLDTSDLDTSDLDTSDLDTPELDTSRLDSSALDAGRGPAMRRPRQVGKPPRWLGTRSPPPGPPDPRRSRSTMEQLTGSGGCAAVG